jgi:hypothetical protein
MNDYKLKKYELVKLVPGVNVPSHLFQEQGAILGVNRVRKDEVIYDVLIPADRDSGIAWLLPESAIERVGSSVGHENLFYTDHKFNEYEIVQVIKGTEATDLVGKKGVIMSMTRSDSGLWTYSIGYPLDPKETICYSVEEKYLEPTGKFMKHEDFYTGESIRVSIDGELLPPDE